MTTHRWLWGLVFGSALLRLALAAGLGPSHDEAYYALFAVHRDWSYFDHPPLVAVVESVGAAICSSLVKDAAFSTPGLRLGFIGLFAGSTLLMARLGGRLGGPRAGLLAALGLNVAGYFGVVAGTFALPDGPLVFFWLATLECLAAALAASPSNRLGPWVAVGLAWAGALLSKYHAVFLPSGTLLYLLLEPRARPWLRRPGPYLAVGLGLLGFAPVLIWNAEHGWASFAFQGGRALAPGRGVPRLDTLAAAVGGQALYLFPWIWLGTLACAWRRVRAWLGAGRRVGGRAPSPLERLLICQAVGPLVGFTAVACLRPVFPHWSLVGFLALLPLLGQDWADRLEARPASTRRRLALWVALPVLLGALAVGHAHFGLLQRPGHGTLGLVPARSDPTRDLYGWDQVARQLRRRGWLDRPGTFLFTGHWYHSGQLALATGYRVPVLCYHHGDARGFAYWSRPEQWVGHDGLLVAVDRRSTEPACFERWFARIEPVGEFPIVRAGVAVQTVRLFRCVEQRRPFPFAAEAASAPAPMPAAATPLPTARRDPIRWRVDRREWGPRVFRQQRSGGQG